jgi:phosphoribosylanthranilate isomerase
VLARFKVCCVGSRAEASLAAGYGACAVGLVSKMPSGPGVISEERIRRIAASVPAAVSTFLLTARTEPQAIAAQHGRCGTAAIQLVDRLERRAYADLRAALPGVRLVQVIHVTGLESVAEAESVAPEVDALLLDSGRPDLPVKELGGTGRTHDWKVSRSIREAVEVPIFLAGGLNAENVRDAVLEVRPYAVDVCSGLRTDGRLDERKLAAFASALG